MAKAEGTVRKRENNETESRGNRKKIKKGKSYYERSWAGLPNELLDMISKNMNIADYLRFGRVCRSWRLFYSETKQSFMESQSPLVIYVSTRAKQSCYFYDIIRFKNNRYKIKLPNFASNFKFCIGVSSGYLIMKDVFSCYFWVMNPVTGHQLHFPRMPHPPKPYTASYCSDRAIFASIGSQEQDFLILIHSKELLKLQYCRSRENQWKEYSYLNQNFHIRDVVVFHGKIFAITNNSQIGILKLTSSEIVFLKLKSAPRLSRFLRFVAHNKQLLIVDFDYTRPVKVYRINFSKMEWGELEDLGNHALFLGKDNMMWSKLINPTMWGGPSNCIYHLSNCRYCNLFSLDGKLLKSFDILQGVDFNPRTYSWYFLSQSNAIDNVRDE